MAWQVVREGLPTRLALGKPAATTTGLPATTEAEWQRAWTATGGRWTADDLRGGCRWLEAGGYLCGRGKVGPAQLARHLEDWLTRAHGDGWAPPGEKPKKHQRVQPLPAERAPNLDHVRAHMRRRGEPT